MIVYPKKCSVCLSVRQKLYLKGERCHSVKCPFERNKIHLPGRHVAFRRAINNSETATFTVAKRIVKNMYRVNSRYLGKLIEEYSSLEYLNKLESRLDNVLYQIGIFPSLGSSRQFISHHSLLINGKPTNLSGTFIKKNDIIHLDEMNTSISKVNWAYIREDKSILIVNDIIMNNSLFDRHSLTAGLLKN